MTLRERFDPLVRRLSGGRLYLAYTLDETEFIGSVEINTSNVFEKSNGIEPPYTMEHDFYGHLQSMGFESNPTLFGISLVAAKKHPETGRVHDVSLRKVVEDDPTKQYHLHYWLERDGDGYEAQIAVHKEYRADFRVLEGETLPGAITRLQDHYRPEYGSEYQQGEAPDELLDIIEPQPSI
jgi:hypothetical protein